MRIINVTTNQDEKSPAFNLAGHDAYYRTFGIGEWYGKTIANVAESRDGKTIVIGWAPGYIRGARTDIEEQITRWMQGE